MDCDSTGTVLGDALADRRRHRPAAVKDEWILDTRGRSFVGQHDLDSLNHVIRSLDVEGTGLLETIAGTGEPGWSGDGTAVAALLNVPLGLAVDSGNGVLYVADSGNHRIRAVTLATGEYYQAEENRTSSGASTDTVRLHGPKQQLVCPLTSAPAASSLLLGSGYCKGSTGAGYTDFSQSHEDRLDFHVEASHGAGTYELRFRYADRYSEIRSPGNRQLRLLVNGVVTTDALVFEPSGPFPSGGRNDYWWSVASASFTSGTNLVQLQVTSHWGPRIDLLYVLPPLPAITTVAGTGVGALPSPEDLTTAQSATASTLRTPSGLVLDVASQLLYIADTENGRVRRLDLGAGTIRTIAGGATTDEVTDGLDAASRKLFRPMGLALDITRALLYVTDFHLNQLRRIDLSSHILTGGTITSVTGAALGAGFELRLRNPMGLVLDSSTQLLYVADAGQARLRVVNPLESCSAELPPQSTLQPCGQPGVSEADCLSLGCCYESNCGLPPNPDGRDTPGFQPEDVLTRVDGAKLDPPISFVNSGGQQCCHPNLRAMSTLDVTPWPQGLALDSGTNMLYVSQGKNHRVVRIHLDDGRCISASESSNVC
ncbi:unnamed protein product [Durusdinium trenchii]|uniref:P-type domain-containing protein n=1 Tax=Durusdinium trenchii TaxID=1381693 RepID=A0ABP0SFH1_9DINO